MKTRAVLLRASVPKQWVTLVGKMDGGGSEVNKSKYKNNNLALSRLNKLFVYNFLRPNFSTEHPRNSDLAAQNTSNKLGCIRRIKMCYRLLDYQESIKIIINTRFK